jgi:exonuclease SbcC
MAVKIKIENYQSIKSAEIEVDGFTVVTGPNNSGKSALMRAVSGVFRNAPLEEEGTVVRHGEDKFRVELDFGADGKVAWEKGPKIKPTYEIDGKVLHPGRDVPDEITALGIRPIMAGGREIWPQTAPQFDQVFLVDQPGSVIAEAVADAERVGKLNRALKSAESDRRDFAKELKIRRRDLKDHEERLTGFDGLDETAAEVSDLAERAGKAGKVAAAIRGLDDLRGRLHIAKSTVETLEGADAIPDPDPDLYAEAATVRDAVEYAVILMQSLAGVRAEVQSLDGSEDALGAYEIPSEATIAKAGKVAGLCVDMEALQRDLAGRKTDALKLEVDLAKAKAELVMAEAEVEEILGDLGECPTCGSPVESAGNHVHREAVL